MGCHQSAQWLGSLRVAVGGAHGPKSERQGVRVVDADASRLNEF